MILTSRGFSFLSGSFIALLTSTILFPYPPLILLFLFLFFTSAFYSIMIYGSYLSKITSGDFAVYAGISNAFSFLGKETQVEVDVIYKGSHRFFCRIEDSTSEGLTIIGTTRWSGVMGTSQSSAKISYSVSALKRGTYQLGPVNIKIVDEHDFCSKEIKLGPVRELVIMPRTKKINVMFRGPKVGNLLFHQGSATSRFVGPEEDFIEVREYTPGDIMRHVDWKAVARSCADEVYVREFERREQGVVLLILWGSPLEPVNERLTEAAISFAEYFINAGDRVGIVTNGPKIAAISPAGGKTHLRSIIKGISEAAYSADSEHVSGELYRMSASTLRFATLIVFGWPGRELLKTIALLSRSVKQKAIVLAPTFSSAAKLLDVGDPKARLERLDAAWEKSMLTMPFEGAVTIEASAENFEGSLMQVLKLLKRRREFAA